jgi:PBP1b-binding outer membrane lipoprotein LpoB
MNKKTMMKRIVSLTMLLLAVMLVFSGCARKTVATKITYQAVSLDASNSWSSTEIDSVGKMLESVYSDADFDVQDMLIAASRGYDLLNDGDAADNVTLGTKDPVETAKKVLVAANEKAKDANKISDESINKMNEADLDKLIASFKTTVDTAAKGGLWDKILCAIGVCLGWITRNLGFGSYTFTEPIMYLILGASALLLLGIYVLMNLKLKKKN